MHARSLGAFSVLHYFDRFFDIAQSWWFKPFGSTMCGLRLFDAVELDTRLVTVAQFHERSLEIRMVAGAPCFAPADSWRLSRMIRSSPRSMKCLTRCWSHQRAIPCPMPTQVVPGRRPMTTGSVGGAS